jgi:4-alpha-glucanotransferase
MSQRQRFRRAAGVAVPLFSLRGLHDLGSGTILDLIPFIDWLDRWHQRVVQLLPLNEAAREETSPYNSSSAFALDPGYISATEVVDIAASEAAREWLESRALQRRLRRLRQSRWRHRNVSYRLTVRLLELGFSHFEVAASEERTVRFERFCRAQAWWLDDFALFRALGELHEGAAWEDWPEELRWRRPEALHRMTEQLAPRVRFARYLQWIAAEQWQQVRAHARQRGVLIKGDLPFVCGRDSADVWAQPELFDLSSSAGAPPDDFSASGQAWGLPLYKWDEMRRQGYRWWRWRARQARELYDQFRIDHVIGLFRTYAMPLREGGTAGFTPANQSEQLAQGSVLMSAILEEAGAAAGVIAEDLGTVPQWARESLSELGIPGYKVLRWEKRDGRYVDPRAYAPSSVATSGTHDTDTLATWCETLGDDERLTVCQSLDLDLAPNILRPRSGPPLHSALPLALLRRLYEAGSVLTILPIQDLFGWRERINTPATIDRYNWTYRLPVGVDELDQAPTIRERMALIRDMIDENGRNVVADS